MKSQWNQELPREEERDEGHKDKKVKCDKMFRKRDIFVFSRRKKIR